VKRAFDRFKVGLACLLCLVAGAVGTWAVQRHAGAAGTGSAGAGPQDEDANPALAPEEVLAALPPSRGKAAVDRAVARAAERARQDPQDAGAWAELGDALMQKARETADAAYYGHAERAYRRALALRPSHADATTGVAWVAAGRHEFETSIAWANKAIALDPRNHHAYGLLGDAAVEMGDYDAAFEHYQKMLDIRSDISSYSRGAYLLFLTGDIRKARWLMDKAIQAGAPYAENTAWCRAQLALFHFHDGHLMAAEQLLQDADGKTPGNFHLLAALGKVKAARKDYPAAIACYQKAAAIAPQHDVLAALGDLHRLSGNHAEAARQDALVEATHKVNKANGVRGDIQIAQFYADHDRNLPEALRLAEEEYRTRKNVFVADTLAWCYYKNGRHEEAKRAIQKALSRRTPDAGFPFHSGMIHARLGDRQTAQLHLYQALSLNPNFSPVYAPVAAATFQELGGRPADLKPEAAP
jgi:tetratricopeptide (TPR) repeat protein